MAPYPPCEDSNGLWAKAWADALIASGSDWVVHFAAPSEGNVCRAEPAPDDIAEGPLTVRRCWSRQDATPTLVGRVLAECDAFGAELVHLHFNYFTYGGPVKSFAVLSRLLAAFARRRIRTIVTLHSVVASPLRYLSTRWGFRMSIPRIADRFFARCGGVLLSRVLCRADEVVVAADGALPWLRDRTSLDPMRTEFIALGSRSARGAGGAVRPTSSGRESPRVPQVIYLGRLVPYKGVETLLRSVGLLARSGRHVQLTVLGSSEDSKLSMRRYARRLKRLAEVEGNGSIRFETRYIPEEELANAYRTADVVVLPFRDDGVIGASGSVLDYGAEYPARIVLTSVPRLGGYRDVPGVDYCPPDNPPEMARSIWEAAMAEPVDPEVRRQSLAQFSPEAVCAQYLKRYLHLAPPSTASRRTSPAAPAVEAGAAAPFLMGFPRRDASSFVSVRPPESGGAVEARAERIAIRLPEPPRG